MKKNLYLILKMLFARKTSVCYKKNYICYKPLLAIQSIIADKWIFWGY
jgi:hypothetical protein